jgi:hypothetical protein
MNDLSLNYNRPTCSFIIGGIVIEEVDKWTHLGGIINIRLNDDDDILSRRNGMAG